MRVSKGVNRCAKERQRKRGCRQKYVEKMMRKSGNGKE